MRDFAIGGPGVPYHKTSKDAAKNLLNYGFSGVSDADYHADINNVREMFDRVRPPGYPSHMNAFFLWPSMSDKWKYDRETIVRMQPEAVQTKCVIADLAILEEAINDTYTEENRRALANEYWSTAISGSLSYVDSLANRFQEAEIFC
jgi:hypothetical protein